MTRMGSNDFSRPSVDIRDSNSFRITPNLCVRLQQTRRKFWSTSILRIVRMDNLTDIQEAIERI